VRLLLDLNTPAGYRDFLAVRALPVHRFAGREAWFPDEYAPRLGLTPPAAGPADYTPSRPGLFDYQRDITALAVRRRKFAVFADCGLGKTLIALEFARHAAGHLRGTRAANVLVVAPLMVARQWVAEAARFYGDALPLTLVSARQLPGWLAGDGSPGRVGVTNYEAIKDGLDATRLGALVLDESSLLKSHYGRWGQRLVALGRGLGWKLCLTGTPAPNDRVEFATHAVFLDQCPTVNSFLARYFVNRGETSNRWELKPHALRPFYRDLSHWSIFLTRPAVYGWRDGAGELPPIRTHVLEVPLTRGQRVRAAELTGNLYGVPGGIGGRAAVARVAKDAAGLKPPFVAALVTGSDAPCLVWCKYNPEQAELARLLPEAGDIHGSTPQATRERLIGEFQAGARRTLISKPKVMGFGLNLQQARRMIFSTVQDSYEEYYQAVKRANRYGSTEPLDVYLPVTDLERPMLATVLRKADRVRRDTEAQEHLFKEVGYDRG
jgi:hypothetical protein